jgi:hypothetical protein
MKGYEIAENLRTTKLRWTTAMLHQVIDGEDYFCIIGMKAFEAGVPISRLDQPWSCKAFPSASWAYNINDDAGRALNPDERKQAVINKFDSLQWRDVDFDIEGFIQYLKNTIFEVTTE